MSGYIIYHYNILDQDRIEELGPLSKPILAKYGGEIVVGSGVRALEGEPYSNMVIYRFNSMGAARAFYESKEAQQLSKLRHSITEGVVVFVPGFSLTQSQSDE